MAYKEIPQSSIDALNQIDLFRVMSDGGHEPIKSDSYNYTYKCPFHQEKTGSFKISRVKENRKTGACVWKCFGCGKSGSGAISLYAELHNLDTSKDFRHILESLAAIGNMVVEEVEVKDLNGKVSFVDAQEKYTFKLRETFTVFELETLGCKCEPLYEMKKGNKTPIVDSKGHQLYKYSWGKDFHNNDLKEPNFDPNEISHIFNLYPVEYYIKGYPGKTNKSAKIEATDRYPIFVYMYDDGAWGKVYEPRFIPTPEHPGSRFSFFPPGQESKYQDKIYGSAPAMDMLGGATLKEVVHKYSLSADILGSKSEAEEMHVERTKFWNIIICSGGSDAINTYYNSGEQVCWFHSEVGSLPKKKISALEKIATYQYLLYDIDDTGKKKALKNAIANIDLRPIFLPESLKSYYAEKEGKRKPCKDAKDYFTKFDPKKEGFDGTVQAHFRQLLKTSLSLRFWETREEEKKGSIKISYAINSARVFPFLASQGLFRVLDKNKPENKTGSFVLVHGQFLDKIDKDSVSVVAREMMKSYILNSRYYTEGLLCTVLDSPRIKPDNMTNLQLIDVNTRSWAKDFDYLFFKNTAVKVTAGKIETVSYDKFPYYVNTECIKEYDFTLDESPPFTIYVNPAYTALVEKRKAYMKEPAKYTDEITAIEKELATMDKLWKYLLKWNVPYDQLPPVIQVIYNQSRVHWRKEDEEGLALTPDEKQEHDAHFINKVCALGMALTRYRTSGQPYMLDLTDANVMDEAKASGGTGKTWFISYMMNFCRFVCNVNGKTFDPKKGGLSFKDYRHGRDTIVHLEDLDKSIDMESLYVWASSGFEARNLYESGISVPKDESPIFALTRNQARYLGAGSTNRRLFQVAMSDYYHSADDEEGMKERKIGEDFPDIENPAPKTVNDILNFSAYAMQFFMKVGDRINPPMRELANRSLIAATSPKFVAWAHEFFSKSYHLNVPLDRDTILSDYFDYSGVSDYTKERSAAGTFKDRLDKYCKFNDLVMNHPNVFKSESDKGRKTLRTKAWVRKTFKVNGEEISVRVLTSSQYCLYFCPKNAIPSPDEPIGKAPEVDPEPIYLRSGAVATLTKKQLDAVLKTPSAIVNILADLERNHENNKKEPEVEPKLPF